MPTTSTVAYSPTHGITMRHWNALQAYAGRTHLAIVLRGGKQQAIRWIELGFPAKPLAMKAKVDRATGLLRCGLVDGIADPAKDREHRAAAYMAGYWVLDPNPAHSSLYVARRSEREVVPGVVFESGRHAWLAGGGQGLVVDPRCRLPLTSDYDIAAIVDTRRLDYSLTYGSVAGRADRSNPMVEAIRQGLNAELGSERIVHGSQSQVGGSPINDPSDSLVAFHPGGDVEVTVGCTDAQATRLLIGLILRYHPGHAHVFHQ